MHREMKENKPSNLIDIHTHILPGVDDGPSTIEESIEMLRQAEKNGVSIVVLTPHYVPNTQYSSSVENNVNIYNVLEEKINEENINVQLVLSNEVFATSSLYDIIANKEVLTINNSRYMLLEDSLVYPNINIEEVIYELSLVGITPIIAHPERYTYINDIEVQVAKWVECGALIQINKTSITSGKKSVRIKAHKLISSNLVHFIASDCHDLKHRTPGLLDIYQYISKYYSEVLAKKLLIENPIMLLKNKKNLDDFVFDINKTSKKKILEFLK